jgi:hypothetical protein
MTFKPNKKKEKQFHIPLNPSRNPKPRVETRSWIPESPEKGDLILKNASLFPPNPSN